VGSYIKEANTVKNLIFAIHLRKDKMAISNNNKPQKP